MPRVCEMCSEHATYGIGTERSRCLEHRTDEMKYIPNNKGKCEDCGKYASYGFVTSGRVSCRKHIIPGMTNLNSMKCEECDRTASYGYPDSRRRIRCSDHKDEEMVYCVKGAPKCKQCDKSASFGYPNQKRVVCATHMKAGMINLKKKHTCEKCSKAPSFGLLVGPRRRCRDHKEDGMIYKIDDDK